jgi:hypothetical protein
MPKEIRRNFLRTIGGILVLGLILSLGLGIKKASQNVKADSVTTTVQVINSAPQ